MNILAIGAHYDDIELGCGGTLAKHISKGDKVIVFVATVSGFKDHKGKLVRSNEIAEREGIQAMKVLGVKNFIQGELETLKIELDAPKLELSNETQQSNPFMGIGIVLGVAGFSYLTLSTILK